MEVLGVTEDLTTPMGSTHQCARCQDEILLTDEVYVLQVVSATMNGDFQILPVQCEDEDYLYEPRFFDFECWEDSIQELLNLTSDIPPLLHEEAILECELCESGICLNEYFAQLVCGEIRRSAQTPDGHPTIHFEPIGGTTTLCLSCLKHINDDVHVMWDEGVDQDGECDEGTHSRCWRYGCEEEVCIKNQ